MSQKPSQRRETWVIGVGPETLRYLASLLPEQLRERGLFLQLCDRQLRAGEHPGRRDLAAALAEAANAQRPLPPRVSDYIRSCLHGAVKHPRGAPSKWTARAARPILDAYHRRCDELRDQCEADDRALGLTPTGRGRRDFQARARAITAKQFGLSQRTVSEILQRHPHRWRRADTRQLASPEARN